MPPTLLDSGSYSAGGTSFATASVTPTSGGRVVLGMFSNDLNADPSVSGCGLTWTVKGRFQVAGGYRDLTIVEGAGTPSAGAITVTRGGADTFSAVAYHVVDVPSTSGEVQSAANYSEAAGGTLAVNFPGAMTSGSTAIAFFAITGGNYTSVPRSGWTELGDTGLGGGVMQIASHYRTTTDTAGGADWTGSGANTEYRAGWVGEYGASGGGGSAWGAQMGHTWCRIVR